MVRDLLIRGMIAGLIAGLFCFGVAKVFGEPQVDRAIAFEEQHAQPKRLPKRMTARPKATMPAPPRSMSTARRSSSAAACRVRPAC